MALKTFIEAVREGLREEMIRDENVIVLGEDVGKKGGVFLATDGLWSEFGDDRVIDTPLSSATRGSSRMKPRHASGPRSSRLSTTRRTTRRPSRTRSRRPR